MKFKAQGTTEWLLIASFVVIITVSFFTILHNQNIQLAKGAHPIDNSKATENKVNPGGGNSNVETAGGLAEIYSDLNKTEEELKSKLLDIDQDSLVKLNSVSLAGYKKTMIQNALDLNNILKLGFDTNAAEITSETIMKILLAANAKIATGEYDRKPTVTTAFSELKEQVKKLLI